MCFDNFSNACISISVNDNGAISRKCRHKSFARWFFGTWIKDVMQIMQVYLWQICCWIQSHKYKTLYAGKEFAPKQLLIIITHMPRQPVEFHHSRAKKWLKGTKSERYLKLQKERVWSNRRYSSTKYDTALTSTVSLAMSNMSGRPGKMLHLISLGWFKYIRRWDMLTIF